MDIVSNKEEARGDNLLVHHIPLILLTMNILMAPRVRIPCQAADTPSIMPTPNYDPRFKFSFVDQTQVPPQMPNVNIPPSNVGDILGMPPMNLAFWNTFRHYMPYNHNLVLCLFRNMQQPTQQKPPQLPAQHIEQATPSQPSPQAQHKYGDSNSATCGISTS